MAPADERGEMEGAAGRYCWRSVGDGAPLVLINGYAATCDDWDPMFLGALAEKRKVICPENRGMGSSGLGEGPLSVGSMAADIAMLLDHLGLDSVAVAGWSMGGFVAQALAAQEPGRVEALVLLSTDPGGEAALRCPPATWKRLTDHSGTPREQARRLIDLLFPDAVAERIDREFGDVVAGARAALSKPALDQQEEAMERWHADQSLLQAPLPMPLLVAAGGQDVVIPPDNVGVLAALSENPWTAIFDGGGHGFMAQLPQRLAGLIDAFLARNP